MHINGRQMINRQEYKNREECNISKREMERGDASRRGCVSVTGCMTYISRFPFKVSKCHLNFKKKNSNDDRLYSHCPIDSLHIKIFFTITQPTIPSAIV
jgi:hypothetical protein